MRCAGITRAGERCKAEATHGSYCWSHAPETAEARKRRARRGGRSGGNGRPGSGLAETAEAKRWIKGLIARLLRGEVERDVATAAFMGINTLARLIEVERKVKETDELEARLEQIEEALDGDRDPGQTNGGYAWRG